MKNTAAQPEALRKFGNAERTQYRSHSAGMIEQLNATAKTLRSEGEGMAELLG